MLREPVPFREPVMRRDPMRDRLTPTPAPVPPAEPVCEPVGQASVARTTTTRTEVVRPPI
jgi:hypothetical protein